MSPSASMSKASKSAIAARARAVTSPKMPLIKRSAAGSFSNISSISMMSLAASAGARSSARPCRSMSR
eukprot:scaffold70697_cov32-Phaeocystis_antarctica.AAC.2